MYIVLFFEIYIKKLSEKILAGSYKTPNILIIGMGYVGLPTALLFASKGNNVIGLDIDQKKISLLQQGTSPIFKSFDPLNTMRSPLLKPFLNL